jgi:dolichol-phosphate mannosyltransferase
VTVSVVVPTYNERENISRLIQETFAHVPDAEIIVVDDDSPDGTSEEVTTRWGHDDRVRLIRRTTERGLPSALADGSRGSTPTST